jgi:acetyl esterase/lipase
VAAGAYKTESPAAETTLAGRRVLRFRPKDKAKPRVLHFHGGGFRYASPELVGPFAEALMRQCQVEVWLPQYRLAPESPFPAALIDVLACFKALREDTPRGMPLIVSGDSAGAGLVASLGVLIANAGNAALIDGLMLLSPWLDLTVSADSYDTNASADVLFSKVSAKQAADLYLQGFDNKHPLASPAHAELSAYPRTLINVGSCEVLLDDSRRFYKKLQARGVKSELKIVDDMQHIAVVRNRDLSGAAEAFAQIKNFIDDIVIRGGCDSDKYNDK